MDTKQILDTLQVQPLSEEEKQSRHILKRLLGPIATGREKTRNDRLYPDELWNNLIEDEIFQEKIANLSLLLEFGHPSDGRETLEPTLACACIPQMPRMINGDLYGIIDVLDTPSGKILNTLIEYGFKPGISSRGSGDLDENNEVDPNTFFLETWDIVPLPAVKKARLTVVESLNKNAAKLKKALKESYNEASFEDKKVMKETLNKLNINIEENLTEEPGKLPNGTPANVDDIPFGEEIPQEKFGVDYDDKSSLNESAETDNIKYGFGGNDWLFIASTAEATNLLKECRIDATKLATASADAFKNEEDRQEYFAGFDPKDENWYVLEPTQDNYEDVVEKLADIKPITEALDDEEETEEEVVETEATEDDAESEEITEEETSEEAKETEETEETSEEETEKPTTLKDLLTELKEYDKKSEITFQPLVVNGETYEADGLMIDDTEEGKLVISITYQGYDPEAIAEDDNIDNTDEEVQTEDEVFEETPVDVEATEEAVNDGTDEIIESYKEIVRQKDELVNECKSLKKEKAVSDAEVSNLKEELVKYQESFARTSELAAKAKTLSKENAKLQEQLSQSATKIEMLETRVANATKLTESVNNNADKVKQLSEALNNAKSEAKNVETKLSAQCEQYKKKLNESVTIAKNYQTKLNAVLNHYIESKAMMLGVRPSEITNRLQESYTLNDIDAVCDTLLESNINMNRLPFGSNRRVKMQETTVKPKEKTTASADGYEIDDSLLELAGLKK